MGRPKSLLSGVFLLLCIFFKEKTEFLFSVFEGLEEGLLGCRKNSRRLLVLPPSFGYGSKGLGTTIPPDSVLVYDVSVSSVSKPKPAAKDSTPRSSTPVSAAAVDADKREARSSSHGLAVHLFILNHRVRPFGPVVACRNLRPFLCIKQEGIVGAAVRDKLVQPLAWPFDSLWLGASLTAMGSRETDGITGNVGISTSSGGQCSRLPVVPNLFSPDSTNYRELFHQDLLEFYHNSVRFIVTAVGPETAEAGPDCASAVHEDEDAWEHLRSVDEVPTGISFSDYVNADANAVTTEVLTDADMLRLVGSVEGVTAEDAADDPAGAEAPVPTPGQVMDALDLLRHSAGAHEGTEDALDALQTYEKSVRLLLTKRTQAKITDFFGGK
ncbi:hypothetical protein V5799_028126 [Amblyomma americanum]|uniref:peptidylprolyl isomerase n=1 Tax=Amblyomma americanum TaxID=6943 RepID=A0AAQ4DDR7_AMBAM